MTAREIADSAVLAVISRIAMLSMAPVFAVTVWLGGAWLDGRFAAQAEATAVLAARVQVIENANLTVRLGILENTIVTKGAARDQQMSALTEQEGAQGAKIDKLVDAISTLSSQLAGLSATFTDRQGRP